MVLIANELEEKKAAGGAAGGPLECYDLNVEGYGPHPSQGGSENVFSIECVLCRICSIYDLNVEVYERECVLYGMCSL